jgi:hypothetical protein
LDLSNLPLPPEPAGLRAETRAFLEDSPEEGTRLIHDARFVAEPLWQEWGDVSKRPAWPTIVSSGSRAATRVS